MDHFVHFIYLGCKSNFGIISHSGVWVILAVHVVLGVWVIWVYVSFYGYWPFLANLQNR
jgi:hypothetical protein